MTATRHLMVDEYWNMTSAVQAEKLSKERLARLPGVPGFSFLAAAHGVFVFDKLARLVSESGVDLDAPASVPKVEGLIPLAWVCPEEAVCVWGVRPDGYVAKPMSGNTGWQITHETLGASVPTTFENAVVAHLALSKILLGEIIEGVGEFTCLGQPLKGLGHTLDELPSMPLTDLPGKPSSSLGWLAHCQWMPGHSLIEKDFFGRLLHATDTWGRRFGQLEEFVRDRMAAVSEFLKSVRIPRIEDQSWSLDQDEQDDAQAHLAYYPEVQTSLEIFWGLYDDYAHAQGFRRAIPYRCEGFLLYVLAHLGNPDTAPHDLQTKGTVIAFNLLNGLGLDEALAEANIVMRYHANLRAQCLYVDRVMSYLARTEKRKAEGQSFLKDVPVVSAGGKIASGTNLFDAARATYPVKYAVQSAGVIRI